MTEYTPTLLAREIAGILRGRAARFDVTQVDLAAATGISQSQISKMLRGKRPMDVDAMDAIAFALGIDVIELVQEANEAIGNTDWYPPARLKYVEGVRLDEPVEFAPEHELPGANITSLFPPEPNWDELDAGQWAAKKKTSADELDPDRD